MNFSALKATKNVLQASSEIHILKFINSPGGEGRQEPFSIKEMQEPGVGRPKLALEDLVTPSVVPGPARPENVLKWRLLRLTPDLLNQNLHFNQVHVPTDA